MRAVEVCERQATKTNLLTQLVQFYTQVVLAPHYLELEAFPASAIYFPVDACECREACTSVLDFLRRLLEPEIAASCDAQQASGPTCLATPCISCESVDALLVGMDDSRIGCVSEVVGSNLTSIVRLRVCGSAGISF